MKILLYQSIVLWTLLSSVMSGAILLPASAAPAARSVDVTAIDAYVTAQMSSMHIPGVALSIVHGDQLVYMQGFGVANPAGQDVTPQTPFILGSSSKSFTALAIMQLVEAGKVRLDAPVQRYIPWFSVATPGASAAITVRHLLNQVSGIPTRAVAAESLAGSGNETLEQEVRALSRVALTAPVGTTFQYSNLNYATLGLIVQLVTGQAYGTYIQQHIFAPLAMQHSFVSQTEAMRHGMATGYRWWFGLSLPAVVPYLRGSLPQGYLISSAEDMAHYLLAQLNNGRYRDAVILSPAGIGELHRPAARVGTTGEQYGMGWFIGPINGEPAVWHGGDTANFHSDMIMTTTGHWGIIALMNVNGNLAAMTNVLERIPRGVLSLLLGHQPPSALEFWQLYLIFDGCIFLCSALALWSLVRLLRGRHQPLRRRRVSLLPVLILPLLWEVVLPLGLLGGFPQLVGVTWPITVLFFPDLGYWLIAICLLLLVTGIIRLVLASRKLRRSGTSPASTVTIPSSA